MAEDLLINVNISGEEDIPKLDDKLGKVGETSKKTTNAFTELRKEMRQAKADMLSYAEGTDEYNSAMQRAAETADKMRDINDKVTASQKDIGVMAKNVAGAISGLAGGFAAAQGVIGLFGVENDKLTQNMAKLMQALSVSQGLANFVDSFDSMKDLYQAVRLNVIALVAAKQKETVATVANTAANVAEAGAITSVGVAAKVTGKAILSALGPYALVAAAIGGLIVLVTNLIKKMNEVPEDIKIQMEIDEKVDEKMKETYTKVIKFAYDYNAAVKSGNKDHIRQLEEIGRKEYGLNKDRLKMIGNNVNNWRSAFKDYIDMAKATYRQEIYIQSIAQAEAEKTLLLSKAKGITEYLKENPNAKNARKLLKMAEEAVEDAESMNYTIEGLTAIYALFYEKNKEILDKINKKPGGIQKETIEKEKKTYLESLKAYEDYYKSIIEAQDNFDEVSRLNLERRNQIVKELTMGETERLISQKKYMESEMSLTKQRYLDLDKQISTAIDNMAKIKMKYDTELKKFNDDLEKGGGVSTPDLEKRKAALEETLKGIGVSEAEIVKMMSQLENLQTKYYDLNAAIAENSRQTWESMIKDVESYLSAFSSITNGIVNLYQAQQDQEDAVYDKKAKNIENSNLSEEQRTKLLEQNEIDRYNAKKDYFEKQKKFEIASAWINFASGVVGIWSKSFTELGPVVGPIVAAAETAGLLATTLAQVKSINSQSLDAPTNSSSSTPSTGSSTSSGSAPSIALTPTTTAMKTSQENLNMMTAANAGGVVGIVKVSEINEVQKIVSVRDTNTYY